MEGEWLVFIGLMATVAAGVFIIVRGLKHRAQTLEMAHRERMAMIDKGIVPSPESNPGHAAWADHGRHIRVRDVPTEMSQRSLTLGIVIVAIGLGFMSVIGVAAEAPNVAFGLGGAIVVLGAAFIVIGQVRRVSAGHTFGMGHPSQGTPPVPMHPPPRPPEPPSDRSSL